MFRAERAALSTPAKRAACSMRCIRARADGTRRSTDAMFEGGPTAIGLTRGMAGFIPASDRTDDEAVRDIVAATRRCAGWAKAAGSSLKACIISRRSNGIVIFAPDRSDRLEFYRHTAPADFNFQDREFATISTHGCQPCAQDDVHRPAIADLAARIRRCGPPAA